MQTRYIKTACGVIRLEGERDGMHVHFKAYVDETGSWLCNDTMHLYLWEALDAKAA